MEKERDFLISWGWMSSDKENELGSDVIKSSYSEARREAETNSYLAFAETEGAGTLIHSPNLEDMKIQFPLWENILTFSVTEIN